MHNGSCIRKLGACRLSDGKEDFTPSVKELQKRVHNLRGDLDSENNIVMKLVAPKYELHQNWNPKFTQIASKNDPESGSKVTLAMQANLNEFRIPNLGKCNKIGNPNSDPKCSKKPSIEGVGSSFTSKLSFETIFHSMLYII